MRQNDLLVAEQRWQKRQLFRSKPRRNWRLMGWLLVVLMLAAVSAVALDAAGFEGLLVSGLLDL